MTDPADFDKLCINCWSGPRCCSTSLMYSFAQRSDATVLDEPLYASYLQSTGLGRPYREQVLAAQETDGNQVVETQLLGPRSKPVLYAKHIGKHKFGVNNSIFKRAQHMILVREPFGVLQSFGKVLQPTQQELGYTALMEIYSELRALGKPPLVVISDDLVQNPEGILRAVCQGLELPFEPEMLSWPAGPKPYDGLWAPWWYANTHKSTGFGSSVRAVPEVLPDHLKPLLGECYVLYDLLRKHAIKPLPVIADPPQTISIASQSASAEDADDGASTSQPAAGQVHKEKTGTHVYLQDPRNEDVLIGMRDGVTGIFELLWRPQAKVSVLDSGFMLGDGVWEGIRVHKGILLLIEEHLDRLWEGAKAIDMDTGISQAGLQQLMYDTLAANGMAQASGVHIRLMMTRGLKPTPYQNPNITIGMPTIVILPEWKESAPAPREKGIRLFTTHVRRGPPDVQDPGWNSHSKLNCISACIQANKAGADEGLMLDPQGFVATCNSTNFFIVRRGEVWAPSPRHQLHGITRAKVLQLCSENGIKNRESDFYLTQVYSADEAFVTGTFAGLIPVVEVDGRSIGMGSRGPLTQQLQQHYVDFVEQYVADGRRHLPGP